MFNKVLFPFTFSILLVNTMMADSKGFSPAEITTMANQHVMQICIQKPEQKNCAMINFVFNTYKNPPPSKLKVIKGKAPFLPMDHARAQLHFNTQDLGKILGWDQARIKSETEVLFNELETICKQRNS